MHQLIIDPIFVSEQIMRKYIKASNVDFCSEVLSNGCFETKFPSCVSFLYFIGKFKLLLSFVDFFPATAWKLYTCRWVFMYGI